MCYKSSSSSAYITSEKIWRKHIEGHLPKQEIYSVIYIHVLTSHISEILIISAVSTTASVGQNLLVRYSQVLALLRQWLAEPDHMVIWIN